jgi:hypothetical protein
MNLSVSRNRIAQGVFMWGPKTVFLKASRGSCIVISEVIENFWSIEKLI